MLGATTMCAGGKSFYQQRDYTGLRIYHLFHLFNFFFIKIMDNWFAVLWRTKRWRISGGYIKVVVITIRGGHKIGGRNGGCLKFGCNNSDGHGIGGSRVLLCKLSKLDCLT